MIQKNRKLHVLVTGANGFIGKNLIIKLREFSGFEVSRFTRGDSYADLVAFVDVVDVVIHLAGENRPQDIGAFSDVNLGLTELLCDAIANTGRSIPVLFASSVQAELDNPYGKSKLGAELVLRKFALDTSSSVYIYRLPGVFGKWCKPNYNSVVATFCHNVANNLSIQINDGLVNLKLVYIDDVVSNFISIIQENSDSGVYEPLVVPEYSIKLTELAKKIESFSNCRNSLVIEKVGCGLTRALYSTYVSYLPPDKFSYNVPMYNDARGGFAEMLKTEDSGQISFFTAHPGVTRGGHYHHSKTEKFMVIKGRALFRFRQIDTNETYEICTGEAELKVVDTVPGWSHNIKNIGDTELVVMLWANEVFDRENPDTYEYEV